MRPNYLHAAMNQAPKTVAVPETETIPEPTTDDPAVDVVLDDGLDGDTADIDVGEEQDAPSPEPVSSLEARFAALEGRVATLEDIARSLNPTIENDNPPPSLMGSDIPSLDTDSAPCKS